MAISHAFLRSFVKGFYDLQKVRIQIGGRLVANFKVKLGQEPGTKEDTLDAEALALLVLLRDTYKKMTDAVPLTARTFEAEGIISDFAEYSMIHLYLDLEREELRSDKAIKDLVVQMPIWRNFLADVKGCGPRLAAALLSVIIIERAEYPSSLWALAGYDVLQVPNDPKDPEGETHGEGRNRKAHHLVTREYTNKEGDEATRQSITFNPFLKTKLYLLGECFLKCGSPYRAIYDNYKHRIENMPKHQDKTKLHRHNMAMRYMIKQFLVDLYNAWRPLEKLPVAPTYGEAKLGMVHGVAS